MPKTAFAIAAHPDDIEFMMSGTLMLLGAAGYELHYMNVSNGNLGTTQYDTATIVAMRRNEAREAAASIGAVFHESLCSDLDIFYDRPTLAQVASVMRDVAPDIVLTHSPVDYMEDHVNAGRLAVTAAFARGMPNFPVTPPRPAIMKPVAVYHAQPYSNRDPLRRLVVPDFYVDVTDREDDKVAMLAKHASQKHWLDESQGLDSYLQTLRDQDAAVGRMSQRFQYAEGWRRHLHVGFCAEQYDPLCEALADRIVEASP
jgi:LmbE family N-acetylglucosaminyl deacetylase